MTGPAFPTYCDTCGDPVWTDDSRGTCPTRDHHATCCECAADDAAFWAALEGDDQ